MTIIIELLGVSYGKDYSSVLTYFHYTRFIVVVSFCWHAPPRAQ